MATQRHPRIPGAADPAASAVRRITLPRLAALALACAAFGAQAQTSSTVGVSATIPAACSIGPADAMSFGSLSLLNTSGGRAWAHLYTAATSFSLICTNGTTGVQLTFATSDPMDTSFKLTGADGTSKIGYNLSPLADGTKIITTGTAMAATEFSGWAADGSAKTLNLYARMSSNNAQGQQVQAYSDTVNMTVSFLP